MIRMTPEAAAAIEDQFDNLSAEFYRSKSTVSSDMSELSSACGEFSGSISEGSGTFELGYREALEVGRTSAGLIASNTNAVKVDFDTVDTDYTWMPSLTETP